MPTSAIHSENGPYQYQQYTGSEKSPRGFKKRNQDVLEIRSGGGFQALFGLPFFAVGVFLLLGAVGIVEFDNADSVPFWAYPVIGFMGLVFAAVGGGLVLGRTSIILDRRTSTVTNTKKVIFRVKSESKSLTEFELVKMQLDTGDSDTPDRYPVSLFGRSFKPFALTSAVSYEEGLLQGEYLAEFLQLPFEDATTQHGHRFDISKSSATSGEDQLVRESVSRPFDMQSRIEEGNGEFSITIPAPPLKLWKLLPVLIPVGVGLFLWSDIEKFLDETNTPPEIQQTAIGVFIFLFVVIPTLNVAKVWLKSKFGFAKLTFRKSGPNPGVILTERGVIRAKSETIPLDLIVDFDYRGKAFLKDSARDAALNAKHATDPDFQRQQAVMSKLEGLMKFLDKYVKTEGIVIKTRKGWHKFGAGLPDQEVAYLCQALRDRFNQ